VGEYISFGCSTGPSSPCWLEEQDEKARQVFTAFESLTGRGKVLLTLDKDPSQELTGVSLSLDGSTFALARTKAKECLVSFMSTRDSGRRDIALGDWESTSGIVWARDGKGVYVSSLTNNDGLTTGTSGIIYVDLKSTVRTLWQHRTAADHAWTVPSPDSRYLAIGEIVYNRTVWALDGF
jgi:hypothetical protein